jgi:fibronectin type 3 domain-containing protein
LTTYFYRTRVVTSGNPSSYSNVGDSATLINIPAAPTNLVATNLTIGQIDLTWSVVPDTFNDCIVYRSIDGTFYTDYSGNLGTNATSYSDMGVGNGQTYWYKVILANASGSSPFSNIVQITNTLAVPAAPTNLQLVTQPTDVTFNLSWLDNAITETSYTVERSDDTGTSWPNIFPLGPGSNSYLATVVTNYALYQYRVYCTNATGNSPYSNIINVYSGFASMLLDKQNNPLQDKVSGYLLDKTGV